MEQIFLRISFRKCNNGTNLRVIEELGSAAAAQDQFAEAVLVPGRPWGKRELAFGDGEDPADHHGGAFDAVDCNLHFGPGFDLQCRLPDGGLDVSVAVNPGDLVFGNVWDHGGIDGLAQDISPIQVFGKNLRVEIAGAELRTLVAHQDGMKLFHLRPGE